MNRRIVIDHFKTGMLVGYCSMALSLALATLVWCGHLCNVTNRLSDRIHALETRKTLAPAAHPIPILRVYAGTLKIDSREWGARTLPGFQEAGK